MDTATRTRLGLMVELWQRQAEDSRELPENQYASGMAAARTRLGLTVELWQRQAEDLRELPENQYASGMAAAFESAAATLETLLFAVPV